MPGTTGYTQAVEPEHPETSEQRPATSGWQPPQGAPAGYSPTGDPPQWRPPGSGGYVPRPERPGSITAAAIVLIVLGVLAVLLGLLFVLVGVTFESIVNMPEFRDQLGDVSAAAGGLFVVFGALFLGDGILQLVSGIFVLAGRSWARIGGLIAGVLGALISLVAVLPAEGGSGGFNFFFVAMLAAYVFVAWVLATSGAYFRR